MANYVMGKTTMRNQFGQISYGLDDVNKAISAASKLLYELPDDLQKIMLIEAINDGRHLNMLMTAMKVIESELDLARCYLFYEIWEAKQKKKQKRKNPTSSGIGHRA